MSRRSRSRVGISRRTLLAAAVAAAAVAAMPSRGHEGHAPLPSKGVEVDGKRGMLVVSTAAARALQIEVADVEPGALDERTLAYARLVAPWNRHAFVATGIGGRVSAVFAKPGESVRRGQRLATIASLELETIQLELLTARAERTLAEQTFARLGRLAAAQIAALRELADARAAAEQARAAVAVAQACLDAGLVFIGPGAEAIASLLEKDDSPILRSIDVVSPVDGTIVHGDVAVGAVVTADEHLFEIIDGTDVWVRIDVLERDINRVRIGQTVELTLAAYPNEPLTATIESKGLMLDGASSLGSAWAQIANPPGVKPRFVPGMNGQARIVNKGVRQMVVVPAGAVVNNGLERYVLVEEAATRRAVEYRRQNVVVEGAAGGRVFLREGAVFPGDRVVTKGSHELSTFFVSEVLRLSPEAEAAMGLRTEAAVLLPIEDVLEFDGIVDLPPGARATVASQIAGRLSQIHVVKGQLVAAGEVLAELSSLELLDMQLLLMQAASQQRLHAESLRRLKALEASESVPRKRVLEVESTLLAASERVEALGRKLRAVGLEEAAVQAIAAEGRIFESLPIRAPIDGSVVRFDGALGRVMRPNETLLEIHDPRHAWVRGYLTERDFGRLAGSGEALAARVRFVAAPERVFAGRVVRSGNVLDADDRTLSVWVELDAPEDLVLQHNMLARISLPLTASAPELAVPLPAIVEQGTQSHVFVRRADGVFVRRHVERGRSDDQHVAITAGLEPGDVVVVAGAAELQTGFAAIR